jgi:lipid A 3-O-deacylase
VALLLVAAPWARSAAQSAVRVRADNDAFNFWLPPWSRPDEEYTSGVRLSVDYAGPAWWSRTGESADCGAPAKRCATRTISLEQDIYTAERHLNEPTARAGSRPDAGWLFVQEEQRLARPNRLDETRLAIGVVGAPALAQVTQRIFHGYAPGWQRPIDWSRQLPFEPGIVASYDQRRYVVLSGGENERGVELQPHAGGSFGNILTEVRAGLGARMGVGLEHPWVPARARATSLAFVADATLRGVARNEFLSGTLFRSSDRVPIRQTVAAYQAGVTANWGRLGAALVAHQDGPEYLARIAPHQWTTIELEWRLGR